MTITNERSAYTLCDVATFLRLRRGLRLEPLLYRDIELRISYRASLATSAGGEREKAARRLHDWIGSEKCHAVVKSFKIDGERAFFAPKEEADWTWRGRFDPEPFEHVPDDR